MSTKEVEMLREFIIGVSYFQPMRGTALAALDQLEKDLKLAVYIRDLAVEELKRRDAKEDEELADEAQADA